MQLLSWKYSIRTIIKHRSQSLITVKRDSVLTIRLRREDVSMEQTKRKRLEAAGWQAGSAADFVGLNDEEAAYVELRVRLSDALKARRLASRLSQKAVATAITSSQSRVAKMEAADPSVSLDLLIRGLIALGVSLAELGRIMSTGLKPGVNEMTLRQNR